MQIGARGGNSLEQGYDLVLYCICLPHTINPIHTYINMYVRVQVNMTVYIYCKPGKVFLTANLKAVSDSGSFVLIPVSYMWGMKSTSELIAANTSLAMSGGKDLCEQRVDREETVYLSVGRNWVSMRQCLEESSTDHVQSYTMCTYWIVAFCTPGRGHWPY